MSAFQNRSKASLRASLIDGTTTAISQRDGQSNRFIIAQHVHDAFWQISLPSLRTTSTWNGQILCLLRTGAARQQILPFLWALKRGHLQKQSYILDLYSWIAFIFLSACSLLVLQRKPLLVGLCVVLRVLFNVFSMFCYTPFGDSNGPQQRETI